MVEWTSLRNSPHGRYRGNLYSCGVPMSERLTPNEISLIRKFPGKLWSDAMWKRALDELEELRAELEGAKSVVRKEIMTSGERQRKLSASRKMENSLRAERDQLKAEVERLKAEKNTAGNSTGRDGWWYCR